MTKAATKTPLGDVARGTHVCLFYGTKDDLLETLVPYFKTGLESREFCVWVISDPVTEQDAIIALKRAVPDVDRFLKNRCIEIIPGREWYLEADRFDLERITRGWNEKLRGALSRGFKAMRVSGDAFWPGTNYWNDFCDYEHKVEKFVIGRPINVLCTYSVATCRPTDVLEMAFAHQFVIAKRANDWDSLILSSHKSLVHRLTPRELQVLPWMARGKTALQTAKILHISKRTVDGHIKEIMQKLGATNKTQAIAIAVQTHIVSL